MEDVHLARAMNYLEAYKMEIGLLVNIGSKSLEFKQSGGLKSIPYAVCGFVNCFQ